MLATSVISILGIVQVTAQQAPDIRSIEPDLAVPQLDDGGPQAGKRIRQVLPGYEASQVYHVIYLPTNYDQSKKHPVIVEFSGNGGYRNRFGDTSDGVPEGSQLGYGISAGKDFIWICLPFVTADNQSIATQWWGSPPEYSPNNTVAYAKHAVADLQQQFGADADAILLCGFSRGAIACNLIGLNDAEIAKLWCGFVAFSHYDGVRDWGLPTSDRNAAKERLLRLGHRPQFICHEHTGDNRGLHETQAYIRESAVEGNFTFVDTGFRNHNDAWVLRQCPARDKLREWICTIPAIRSALSHLGGTNELGN